MHAIKKKKKTNDENPIDDLVQNATSTGVCWCHLVTAKMFLWFSFFPVSKS